MAHSGNILIVTQDTIIIRVESASAADCKFDSDGIWSSCDSYQRHDDDSDVDALLCDLHRLGERYGARRSGRPTVECPAVPMRDVITSAQQ